MRAAAAARPLNSCLLQVERSGTAWQVSDAPTPTEGSLDVSGVQAFWRARAGSQDTLVEDLTLALMRRFVRTMEIADPRGFAALHGRGVLYLANHQLDLESALFVSAVASLQGTVTTAIARQELGESWIGPFFDTCFQHPQLSDPHMLLLIDRASPEAVWQALAAAVESAAARANSLLVHVEGKHALQAGEPVEVVSTSLIDLAVANGMPIVPLRFAGGLPVARVANHWRSQWTMAGRTFGSARRSCLKRWWDCHRPRKAAVLAALNGFGDRWRSETPNAGDADFAAAVAAWRQAHGVSEVQAVLWRTLAEVANPSLETQVLQALAEGKIAGVDALDLPRRRWLAQAAAELFGLDLNRDLGISPSA